MSLAENKPIIVVNSFDVDAVKQYLSDLDKIDSKYPSTQPILVNINSPGGSVDGLSMLYDRLVSAPNPIITYTSGIAMSAGAILLSAAGDPGYRIASPEASIMVHEIQAINLGDIKEMEDRHKYLRMINTKWMGVLAKSMGLNSASDIRKMIKEKAIGMNVFLSAKQAKDLNIVDEIGN